MAEATPDPESSHREDDFAFSLDNLQRGDPMLHVLNAIPCGVVVIDRRRRILAANDAFRRILGISGEKWSEHCMGSALHCINAGGKHPHDDEWSAECHECGLRRLASDAFAKNRRLYGSSRLDIEVEGNVKRVNLEMTAVPITIAGEAYAVLIVENMTELRCLRSANADGSTHGMIGRDASMLRLYELIQQIGPLDVPVLVQGESGTGKELAAQALHRTSPRSQQLMVPVNCGALPDGLLESELFGHVRGAFTGAVREKKGRFQLANGGTIFLDEIGELSPAMQVKFLRVLQNGSFHQVGGEQEMTVDARVVCATNRDLDQEVAEGKFRSDLYYRLCVVPIRVPPLRERSADIPLLAEHFLKRIAREHSALGAVLTDEAIEALTAHTWPGNVRELENAIRYAAIRSRGAPIECGHLPPNLYRRCAETLRDRPRGRLDVADVRRALRSSNGNKSHAAMRLGVSRTTLWRYIKKHPMAGLGGDEPRSSTHGA